MMRQKPEASDASSALGRVDPVCERLVAVELWHDSFAR
jgi:hypothetical protein